MWGIPFTPLMLGLAGLIPFFTTAGYAFLHPSAGGATTAAVIFGWYGAVILAFLGGARWGMELARAPAAPNRLRLIISMTPPIYAAVGGIATLVALDEIAPLVGVEHAGMLYPVGIAAFIAIGFIAHWMWDEAAGRADLTPAWYLPLRRLLTACVLAACIVLAAAAKAP